MEIYHRISAQEGYYGMWGGIVYTLDELYAAKVEIYCKDCHQGPQVQWIPGKQVIFHDLFEHTPQCGIDIDDGEEFAFLKQHLVPKYRDCIWRSPKNKQIIIWEADHAKERYSQAYADSLQVEVVELETSQFHLVLVACIHPLGEFEPLSFALYDTAHCHLVLSTIKNSTLTFGSSLIRAIRRIPEPRRMRLVTLADSELVVEVEKRLNLGRRFVGTVQSILAASPPFPTPSPFSGSVNRYDTHAKFDNEIIKFGTPTCECRTYHCDHLVAAVRFNSERWIKPNFFLADKHHEHDFAKRVAMAYGNDRHITVANKTYLVEPISTRKLLVDRCYKVTFGKIKCSHCMYHRTQIPCTYLIRLIIDNQRSFLGFYGLVSLAEDRHLLNCHRCGRVNHWEVWCDENIY